MKQLTFLTGYYGSGKTEIAVNLVVQKQLDMIVDLDIINPYFRSREKEDDLKKLGIETISSDLEYKTHIDLPYISKKVFKPFHNKDIFAVYDLGGNDLGAKLLRQFEDYKDRDIDLLVVVNINRPETDSQENIIKLVNKIEGTGGFKVTGLINNSNFLKETKAEDVKLGEEIIQKAADALGLEILYTTVWENVDIDGYDFAGEILPIKLYFRKDWL